MHVNKSVSLDMTALSIIDGLMLENGHSFSTTVNNIIMQWKQYDNGIQKEYKRLEREKKLFKNEVIK